MSRNSGRGRCIRPLIAVAVLVLLAGLDRGAWAGEAKRVVIGAGAAAGNYFPVAGALCELFNAAAKAAPGQSCVVLPSRGSIENINALRAGDIDFAIVQSDWQFQAQRGSEAFTDTSPFTTLRAVFALYAEPLVFVASRKGDLRKFEDLQGMRVGIGAPGTHTRAIVEDLVAAAGWSMGDFESTIEHSVSAQIAALCDGEIDAAGIVAGSPSTRLADIFKRCDTLPLAITGAPVDAVITAKPYYRRAEIPAGVYDGIGSPVPTLGVGATLVTRADVPSAVVERLVAAVADNVERLKTSYPVLKWLTPAELAGAGLTAPLHPVAARIYTARGWLP